MRRNIVIALIAFLSIGLVGSFATVDAQTKSKKKKAKPKTEKKQEEAPKQEPAVQQAPPPVTPPAGEGDDEGGALPELSALVSSDTGFVNDFGLDTSRP